MLLVLLGALTFGLAGAATADIGNRAVLGVGTDGPVNAIAELGSTVYLGGSFQHAGLATGGGADFAPDTGVANVDFPQVSGGAHTVDAVISDGAGGFFIGGDFTDVGGLPRNDLAHILPDGTVDASFDVVTDTGSVRSLALSPDGSTLYVGGLFNQLGGVPETNLGAVDLGSDTTLSGFAPTSNGAVDALAITSDGLTLYAGGSFTNIGNAARTDLAAIDTSSATALSWNPAPDGIVHAIVLSSDGSEVYVGGDFTHLGATARGHVAGIAAADAALDAHVGAGANAANGSVDALAISPDDGTLYVGGAFASIGGGSSTDLAAITIATGGLDTDFSSGGTDGPVNGLGLSSDGSELYLAGNFANVGGTPRNYFAEVDASDGSLQAWNPNTSGLGTAVASASDDSSVYGGGTFSLANEAARSNLAAVSTSSETLASWNPGANGAVDALAAVGSTVYVGGEFDTLGASTRDHLGAIGTNGNVVAGFVANTDDQVRALAVSGDGNTVYAGGFFTSINGTERDYIGAVNATTGVVDASWNPTADGNVWALAVSGSAIYAGGEFSTIGGHDRNGIAELDNSIGHATSWDPGSSVTVRAIVRDGSNVFLGLQGTGFVGGQTRANLAEVDASSGAANPAWNPAPNDSVYALALGPDGTLFVGGGFTSIAGVGAAKLVAFKPSDSTTPTSFQPNPNGDTYAIQADEGSVYAGGAFSATAGGIGSYFATFFEQGSNTTLPTISGTALPGDNLTCDPGTWDGPDLSFSYQWLSDGTPLVGENTNVHTVTYPDVGTQIACQVTATNHGGPVSATSAAVTPDYYRAPRIFFADYNGLGSIDYLSVPGGGGGGTIDTSGGSTINANGLALDPANGLAYWVEQDGPTVESANLSGSGGQATLDTSGSTMFAGPNGLAFYNGTLYWGDYNTDSISWADTGGNSGDLPINDFISGPSGVAVDPVGGKIYWTNGNDNAHPIGYANLDGSGAALLPLASGASGSSASGVAVDEAAGRIYWANSGSNTIDYENLDGSGGGGVLATGSATVSHPIGLAIDHAGGRIYWANGTANKISWASLDPGCSSNCSGDLDATGATVDSPSFVALLEAPALSATPNLTGTPEASKTVTCAATWLGNDTGAFLFRAPQSTGIAWLRDGSPFNGPEGSVYHVQPGDIGHTIACRVSATNLGGTTTTASAARTVFPADGSGTATASMPTVSAAQTGLTETLSYTVPAGGMSAGGVQAVVPAGWTAPQKSSAGGAGYVTASTGTLAISGQTITVSGLTKSAGQKVTITYKNGKSTATPGNQAWAVKQRSIATGTYTAIASSPHVTVFGKNGAGTINAAPTSIKHGTTNKTVVFTFKVGPGGMSGGTVTLAVPTGWTTPTVGATAGIPSISGHTITISGITKIAGATFTITISHVKPPATAVGNQTWATKERSTAGGVLTALAVSPVVKVTA